MDEDAGNRWRLDARVIVAAVRDEEIRSYWLARAVFGAVVTALIVIISGPPLFSWPLLVGIPIGIMIAFIANGETLLQLSAEVAGTVRRVPRSLRAKSRGDQVMAAGLIEPGTWICHHQDYEDLRSKAQEEYRRQREEHDRQEDDRIEIVRSEWETRKKVDAERGITYSYQPYELRRRPYYGGSRDPKKRFELAMVARISADGKSVTFGFVRGGTRVVATDERFYVGHPRVRRPMEVKQIDEAAAALPSLLETLNSEYLREDELIATVRECHSRDAISRAIRGALAVRLIGRRRGLLRILCEFLCIFSLATNHTVERQRKPVMTDIGRMWLEAHLAVKKMTIGSTDVSSEEGERMAGGGIHVYGGQVFYNSQVGSAVNSQSHEETHLHINNILSRIVETYESQPDRARRAADPEALEDAISQIRAVLEDGRPATSSIMPALKVIVRIGEGLFLGVAGNALYAEILQWWSFFPGGDVLRSDGYRPRGIGAVRGTGGTGHDHVR